MASTKPDGSRRSTRYRRPPPPQFVPAPPSEEYLALSEIPSSQLSPNSDRPESRKLLVLDLNGTLVLRSPRAYYGPRTVMPRPYSKTFRKYVFREGSHLDVMVWSSAQPHSVDSMLDSFFESDRRRLVGVWARDTLGLSSEHYSQKVQTVKDLNTIWNAPAGLPPPVKVMPPPPMAVLTNDPTSIPGYDPKKPPPEVKKIYTSVQLMPEAIKDTSIEFDRTGYFEIPKVKRDDPIPGLSIESTAGSSTDALPGLYSALNTLLLDDSALKAHLQPHNHLTLPEYTADLRARDVRRRNALDELQQAHGTDEPAEDDVEEEAKADSLVEPGDTAEGEGNPTSDARSKYKSLRAAPFDKSLIGVIGVLAAIQYQSSLVGWMRAGGMRPDAEEMARVAALFQDEAEVRPEESSRPKKVREGDTTHEDDEGSAGQVIPAKRLSGDSGEKSAKRHCPEPAAGMTDEAGMKDLHFHDSSAKPSGEATASVDAADPASSDRTGPSNPPKSIDQPDGSSSPSHSTPATIPTSVLPISESSEHTNEALPQPKPQPSSNAKRKRQRTRQKPVFPADHPLSANDSYPFFIDGKPEAKLWFQDREIYTYWVRRGLLALKECGIEPEDGVDV